MLLLLLLQLRQSLLPAEALSATTKTLLATLKHRRSCLRSDTVGCVCWRASALTAGRAADWCFCTCADWRFCTDWRLCTDCWLALCWLPLQVLLVP
jgi:hypothetical protein